MKNSFLVLVGVLVSFQVYADKITCPLEKNSKYWKDGSVVSFKTDAKDQAKLSVTQGELYNELASIDGGLFLVSQGMVEKNLSNYAWKVATYFASNNDDTGFLITLTTQADLKTARANIQVLVDGLEGGTRSHSLECTIKH